MKLMVLLFISFLLFQPAFAQDAQNPQLDKTNPFYLGLGIGVDSPGSGWDPNYLVGGEANALFGYALDKCWAVQLDGGEYFFTGTGYSLYQVRGLVEAKYTFDGKGWQSVFAGKGWQSYVLAGPGIVFQSLSPSGDSTANFDALLGAGLQWDLAPRTRLFIEAKFNFIMSQSTTFFDVPVDAGIWVGL